MELNNKLKATGKREGQGPFAVAAPVVLSLIFGVIFAIVIVALLLRGLLRTEAVSPGHGPAIGSIGLMPVLLGAIIILLMGIFLILLLLLCKCGCGCGGADGKSLLQLLATLVPGLTTGFRAGARGFEAAAEATHAAIDPLHTAGYTLRDTLGPAIANLNVPTVGLPNRLLWDVLNNLHLVTGPRPRFMDSIWVLTGVELGTHKPFGEPNGLGSQLTNTGGQLKDAGDRAAALEPDLRAGASGLRSIATAIDGQP